MKKKTLLYSLALGAGLVGLVGVSAASAFGPWGGITPSPDELASRHTAMFQHHADLLGVSVDEVKSAWAEGKSMMQLATEKGITAEALQTKMKEARLTQMKSELQTLVQKGIITQAQADQRLKFMESNQGGKMYGKGMMRMHGVGF